MGIKIGIYTTTPKGDHESLISMVLEIGISINISTWEHVFQATITSLRAFESTWLDLIAEMT